MTVCATPCGHVFHFDCVSDWVDEHRHCPQCRQRVLSSSRLVTLYFAHEKKSSSAGTLRNALPTRHDVWDNTLNHENSGGGGVGSDDTAVIMDVMQCQLDDLDSECQKLRKALARSEEQLRATAEELRVIEAQQDGALDIKAISRELDMVRAEQDDLQRTSQHLREEIAILNENIGKKDLEIRQKDAAYEYLLGRNAILLEQTETNERLVSSLRHKFKGLPQSIVYTSKLMGREVCLLNQLRTPRCLTEALGIRVASKTCANAFKTLPLSFLSLLLSSEYL